MMCHLDQNFIFTSFLHPALPLNGRTTLSHCFSRYTASALPLVIALEIISYTTLTANLLVGSQDLDGTRAWGMYVFSLGCLALHALNAPSMWAIMKTISDDSTPPEQTFEALRKFLRRNWLRVALTDVPAVAALFGAVVTVARA
jgi:hypothetical protein